MKNTLVAVGILSIGLLASCKKEYSRENADQPVQDSIQVAKVNPGYQPTDGLPADEILIQFKPGTTENSRKNVLAQFNGIIKKQVHTPTMESFGDHEGFYVVKTNAGISQAIERAKAFADVAFAEPNYVITHQATANDPYASASYLWGMHTGYGSQAVTAWGKNQVGSSSVAVGIVDEGVNYDHPDLKDNIWRNPGETLNGVDDDKNGYIDDVNGWDFYSNDKTVYDGTDDDHGTHVAGTIGAKGNNGVGVAGLCWNITMIPAKFMGTNGGYVSDAIEAIDYLVNLKQTKGLNLVAINNSWGGGGYSSALYSAIERANSAGILFMAAAGNGNSSGVGYDIDKQPTYPASYTNANVVTVAAIDANGALASFSNFGVNSVDLGAPGVKIASTVPGGYAYYNGTSMATPHVTSAAALYAAAKGLRPRTASDAAVIKNALLTAASNTKTPSLNQKTLTGGRLNVSGF
jgi:subtilisin family serine protease